MGECNGLTWACDEATGRINSFKLFGRELLDKDHPDGSEIRLNGLPLAMRPAPLPGAPAQPKDVNVRLRGERFVNHFTGAGLVMNRVIGTRPRLPHRAVSVAYYLMREQAELSYHCPGPGGPVLESPLYVETLTLMNWNWRFWGADTRMIFPNSYSSGPDQEMGHMGYEHNTPEECKRFMGHVFRRHYPGGMVLQGAAYYNRKTGHWLAITCRRPNMGYILNIGDAGRGVCYDLTFHAMLPLGTNIRLPEVTLYYGESKDEMMQWMADHATFYYEEPPAWTHKTLWGGGIAWDNEATWLQQGEAWERQLDDGQVNGIWINLVTKRPMLCGTSPTGYDPDPMHGTIKDFRKACRRVTDRGAPLVIWMSHSGFLQGAQDIDDDWFIRGSDGRLLAAWGPGDAGSMMYVNPGHPGYRAYTRKWIEFYIKECGAKVIFFDCLGFPIPPDFRPRPFMRYPGDAAIHAIGFMEEMYAFIKSCDPEAVMIGEGTSLDGPVEMFSVIANTRRAIDGFGPRDYLLNLNRYASKKMTIYSDHAFFPASGFTVSDTRPEWKQHNRYMLKLLGERGGRDAFQWVPGTDCSVLDATLFVSVRSSWDASFRLPELRLPSPWSAVRELKEEITGIKVKTSGKGGFRNVKPGFYRMS